MKRTFAVPGGVLSMAAPIQKMMKLFVEHRDWFYDNMQILPYDTFGGIWSGGRIQLSIFDKSIIEKVLYYYNIELGIPFRQIYTNLFAGNYLNDEYCNTVVDLIYKYQKLSGVRNEIVIGDDRLYNYLKFKYPDLCYISSVTKTLLDVDVVHDELNTTDYDFVCLWCSFNDIELLKEFSEDERKRLELLICQPCNPKCKYVGMHNLTVSSNIVNQFSEYLNLPAPTLPAVNFKCHFFSMTPTQNLLDMPWVFKSEQLDELNNMNYSMFKITGRNLKGNQYQMVLQLICYYLIKPEFYNDFFEAIRLEITVSIFDLYGDKVINIKK